MNDNTYNEKGFIDNTQRTFRENFVAFNFPFPVRKWNLDRFNEKLVKTLEGNLLSISGTVSQTPIQDPKRHIKNYFNSIYAPDKNISYAVWVKKISIQIVDANVKNVETIWFLICEM